MHAASTSSINSFRFTEGARISGIRSNIKMKQESKGFQNNEAETPGSSSRNSENIPPQGAPVFLLGEPYPVVIAGNNSVKNYLSEDLYSLVLGFANCEIFREINARILFELSANYPEMSVQELETLRAQTINNYGSNGISNFTMIVESQFNSVNSRLGANWWGQFKILSMRTLKNIYRNPDLLQTHYVISVVMAFICGLLFWRVDNTLSGFQNRLGVFFFICALFGFSCLSSMQVFYN
jgi:hypothetical protein